MNAHIRYFVLAALGAGAAFGASVNSYGVHDFATAGLLVAVGTVAFLCAIAAAVLLVYDATHNN